MARKTAYCRATVRGEPLVVQRFTSLWTSRGSTSTIGRSPISGTTWSRTIVSSRCRVPRRFEGSRSSHHRASSETGVAVLTQGAGRSPPTFECVAPCRWSILAPPVPDGTVGPTPHGRLPKSAGSVGEGAGESEAVDDGVVEAGDRADPVPGERQDEHAECMGQRRERVAQIDPERGLAVRPGRHQSEPPSFAERHRRQEAAGELPALVF